MGEKPRYLYKYCSADRALQVLSENTLYLCPPEQLNDLCEFTISRLGSYDRVRAKFLEYVRWRAHGLSKDEANARVEKMPEDELRKNYEYFETKLRELNSDARLHSGVTCFSARFMDQRMWSQYGDNHAGVIIQFSNADDASKVHTHALPVRYSNDTGDEILARLMRPNGAIDVEVLASELYLTKTKDWRDEEEWRILMLAVTHQSREDRLFAFPSENVRRVFLGPRISQAHRSKIEEICRQQGAWSVIDVVPVPNEARFEYRGVERIKSFADLEFWEEHRLRPTDKPQ